MIAKQCLILCLLLFTAFDLSRAQDTSANALNEFQEFTADSVITTLSSPSVAQHTIKVGSESNNIVWGLAVLLFTALAGILVRFKQTRQLRSLFLVLSIVVFGFYRGACPCSIQSLQHSILLIKGIDVRWQSILLFAGLIPLTYLFGRVYCGWICQLGALQELIFRTSSFKVFQTEVAQKIMRIIRIVALSALITQLLITGTNLYKRIDPFTTIYNFYSANAIGWILAAIVILSSFLMYRPFCKTICPIGLVLGWISKLPGASVLAVKQNCISCVKCSKGCKINAITHDTRVSIIDNQECIRCGECLNQCVKDSLFFSRNGRNHPSKAECKPSELSIC
jgi:NosR/NirI family nitrous oxide reductase transcriptional regulator